MPVYAHPTPTRAAIGTRAAIRKHSVTAFFVVALAISWAGIVAMVGPGGIPATTQESEDLGGVVYVPMLLGPAVAGLLCIGLVGGRTGLHDLRARLLRWRVHARWYAFALLAPIVGTATLVSLSPISSELRPEALITDDHRAVFVLTGIAVGLMVGLFEEIGWTGFAVPRLRLRYGVLATGWLVGLAWGVWHLPLFILNSGDSSGALDLSLFVPALVFCLVLLPVFRVLMVWIYDHTTSVFLAIVMHASLTGGVALILIPLDAEGWPLVTWYLVFTGALAAVGVALVEGGGALWRGRRTNVGVPMSGVRP